MGKIRLSKKATKDDLLKLLLASKSTRSLVGSKDNPFRKLREK